MQNVALAWLVLELSGSPLAIGALAFWRFVPFTVFGLVAGVVADRIESRKLVMATQASAMAISIALAVVTLTGTATLPIVYVLAALGGVALAFDAPGRQSLTFQMVGPRELPNAVALNSGLFNGSRVIGPAIAGLLIAAVGTGLCFVLNAFSFLAVLAALAVVRDDELHPVERDPSARSDRRPAPRIRVRVGHDRSCASSSPSSRVVSLIGFNFHVLVPLLAADTLHVGPEGFGLLSASFGLGALVGALATATFRAASWRLFATGAGLFGVLALLLAPVQNAILAGRDPVRDRHLVHALHRQCQRARPARCARPPARAPDRGLPLRVRRHRPGRRAARGLARRPRRHDAGVRRRRRHVARFDRRRERVAVSPDRGACDLLGGDERVRRIDLRLSFDAGLGEHRRQLLAPSLHGFFGLPDVDDTKAVRSLPRDVSEQALDRPVRRRLHSALAAGEQADDSSYCSCVNVGDSKTRTKGTAASSSGIARSYDAQPVSDTRRMDVFRTPDEQFEGLSGYSFEPHYLEQDGLRMHYVEEGAGDPVLLLHGEPTWAFLYRKMIPTIAGVARAIAPDYFGFGRSDKPTRIEDYSYDFHYESIERFADELDLRETTVVVQDWGGPIGLRLAVERPGSRGSTRDPQHRHRRGAGAVG